MERMGGGRAGKRHQFNEDELVEKDGKDRGEEEMIFRREEGEDQENEEMV
jgi:hypothetical protein